MYVTVLLLGAAPLNFDLATSIFHVPTRGSPPNINPGINSRHTSSNVRHGELLVSVSTNPDFLLGTQVAGHAGRSGRCYRTRPPPSEHVPNAADPREAGP